MKLTKLQLENFRNYQNFTHDFAKNKNLILIHGPNGQGKTNFLEAIYLLSLGKSFRTTHQDNLVLWDFDYYRIKGEVEADDESQTFEVFYASHPQKQKSFKINDVKKKNSEYIGNFLTVLFQPEDLNILYLSPSLRRKYMDILLSQVDKVYLESLMKYGRVLKQRNVLLQEIREKSFKKMNVGNLHEDLSAWDQELMEFGYTISKKRRELVEFLEKKLEKIYQSISGKKEKLKVHYQSKITDQENYHNLIEQSRQRDILQGKTNLGPHRDDLIFFIDDKEITQSASRGEVRTLLLAIKLAEIAIIKEKTKQTPLLLLDDVFSELDSSRRLKLLKSIKDCQTIITTTNLAYLDEVKGESELLEL
jgi:DNA replication and repair protein RecF